MGKRFFTVQEANDLIPFLTDRLVGLRATYNELESGRGERTPPLQDLFSAGGMSVDSCYFHLICKLHSLTSEICAEGCEIKDLHKGLVDFPTIWEGREVFLCWQLGEPEVNFWHEIDAGFAGRQPLKTDLGYSKKGTYE
jgi:hypothetical protein